MAAKKDEIDKAMEAAKFPPKPVLDMGGGNYASEQTQTVGEFGNYYNIPTIDPENNRSVTTKEAIRLEKERNGGRLEKFPTIESAVTAAGKRSKAGGRDRKKR